MSRRRAALLVVLLAATPLAGSWSHASAQPVVSVRVTIAPPPLPVYAQPVIPADGYLWAPGYWDWDPVFGYYWVPGTWVLPPRPNLLWTPGYWGWDQGVYVFHSGYWDADVGYYGGVDYGYGYAGTGYQGGYWQGPRFFYNKTVNNITTVAITNIYTKTVIASSAVSRVSYNGGAGGLRAQPTARDRVIGQLPHVQPTPAQVAQVTQARALPVLRAAANHGAPPIAATPRPAAFHSPAVTQARPQAGSADIPALHPPANAAAPAAPRAENTGHGPAGAPAALNRPPVGPAQAQPLRGDQKGPAGLPAQVNARQPEAETQKLRSEEPLQQEQRRDAQKPMQQQDVQRAQQIEAEKQAQEAARQRAQQQQAQQVEAHRRAQALAQQHRQEQQRVQQLEAEKQAQEAARQRAQQQQAQQVEAQRRAQQVAQQRQQEQQRAQQVEEAQRRSAQAAAAQRQAEQRHAAEPRPSAPGEQHHAGCGQPGEPPCR